MGNCFTKMCILGKVAYQNCPLGEIHSKVLLNVHKNWKYGGLEVRLEKGKTERSQNCDRFVQPYFSHMFIAFSKRLVPVTSLK